MLMMAGLPLLLALVFVSTPAARATIAGDRSPLVVETSGGAVLGRRNKGSSNGSSSGSTGGNPGKACFQTPYDPTTPQSEDCLHLTVWAPRSDGADRPVIVFFYGGGALSGATDWYNFSTFARDGAVVIAPNYRLGPLGFMATKELSATSDTHASGNYGLMDCEMA
eukprot:gene27403-34897_t